jgi:N-acyl-L-homoserine lactone synthetase
MSCGVVVSAPSTPSLWESSRPQPNSEPAANDTHTAAATTCMASVDQTQL